MVPILILVQAPGGTECRMKGCGEWQAKKKLESEGITVVKEGLRQALKIGYWGKKTQLCV